MLLKYVFIIAHVLTIQSAATSLMNRGPTGSVPRNGPNNTNNRANGQKGKTRLDPHI